MCIYPFKAYKASKITLFITPVLYEHCIHMRAPLWQCSETVSQTAHTCIEISSLLKWKWRDIRPSMVTHTWNLCSAFNPSKVHTHSEHTRTLCLHHLCCGARGAVGGSVPQEHLSHGIEGGESAVYALPPPTIPAGPETRTRSLWIMSPTL